MRKRRSVALLVETSNAYARGLLAGIMAYVRQHQPWSIYLPELGRGDVPPTWRGDGIIARIETKAIARAVARTRLPVVDVSAGRHRKDLSRPVARAGEVAFPLERRYGRLQLDDNNLYATTFSLRFADSGTTQLFWPATAAAADEVI